VCSWKTIVVNTPRTLQEILPALMAEVIDALADAGGWGCIAQHCHTLACTQAPFQGRCDHAAVNV
jgi:hypothetical protein